MRRDETRKLRCTGRKRERTRASLTQHDDDEDWTTMTRNSLNSRRTSNSSVTHDYQYRLSDD